MVYPPLIYMKTLEAMVDDILRKNNCCLNPEVTCMEDVIDYIDTCNENREPGEPVYTPEQWYLDTKDNYPEYLLDFDADSKYWKDRFFEQACFILIEFKDDTIAETGKGPTIYDYEHYINCKEFQDKMERREFPIDRVNMSLAEMFSELLEYWNRT